MYALFLHCPSVADDKSVHLDAGHGLGVVQLAIAAGSKRTAIGVEQDPDLHCLAKECDAQMNASTVHTEGRRGKVSFRCSTMADFDVKGVHVVHMYEAMAGRVHGDNEEHMAFVERLMQTPSVHIFTSTKLQSNLLSEYRSRSTIINEQLTFSWVAVKIDGPKRRGNAPGNFLFMRWRALLEGINFDSYTPSHSAVAELVQAAYQKSIGNVWSLRLSNTDNLLCSKLSAVLHNTEMHMIFGNFELDCYFTGLKLVTGCAVTSKAIQRTQWLIGFASEAHGLGSTTPALLVLKNDSLVSQDQFTIIRQVDLIAVDASTDPKIFQVEDFCAAKAHFKASVGNRRSARNSGRQKPNANDSVISQPAPDHNIISQPAKKRQAVSQVQVLEKHNQNADDSIISQPAPNHNIISQPAKKPAKKPQAVQVLEKHNQNLMDTNKSQTLKIKSLQQIIRREKKVRGEKGAKQMGGHRSSPSDDGQRDDPDRDDWSPSETASSSGSERPSKWHKPGSGAPETASSSGPGPEKIDAVEQNVVSTSLEERIAEQTRELNVAMIKQQDKILGIIKEANDMEKLKREEAAKTESNRVEQQRFDKLHGEMSDLRKILAEKENDTQVKKLQETNDTQVKKLQEILAQSLKDRDKDFRDRSMSESANRSSVLSSLKEAKELMTLLQGGPSGGSQTGGGGKNYDNAAGAGYNGYYNPYSGHYSALPTTEYYSPYQPQAAVSSWPTHQPPQWPTGYPPSHQPPWPTGQPQWHTGYPPPHQPPPHQPPYALPTGCPPYALPTGQDCEASGKQSARSLSRSRSPRKNRSPRSPRKNHSSRSASSSAAQYYHRSELEGWGSREIQRWLHNNGVNSNDTAMLTGRNGTLQDGMYLLSTTYDEFIALFPSSRSTELALRVLWKKIDAMQQAP
jgi:hypothetical protein